LPRKGENNTILENNNMGIIRDNELYFNPETGEIKDNNGSTTGYIEFSFNEDLILYRNEYGVLDEIKSSGSNIKDEYKIKIESYKDWKYYEE
jgi:hypothetical protein